MGMQYIMSKINILIIGSGGREFAVARAFKKSSMVNNVYMAPGNAATKTIAVESVPIVEDDFKGLKDFAIKQDIAWTFVGPEDALVAGVVDYFTAFGLKIFGPNVNAAQLEGSKEYALKFMQKYNIPHPKYQAFNDSKTAISHIKDYGLPVVIKADGLAAGKGVTIAITIKDAEDAIKQQFKNGQSQVVLEENLVGPEYSFFVVVEDGYYRILPIAQDHKRAYDGDNGPNTGGMGSYSPVPQLKQTDYKRIVEELIKPTMNGLKQENYKYHGILYFGLMLTQAGPKMIEFNVRLGDPETEVMLPRLKTDFAKLVDSCLKDETMPEIRETSKATIVVVLASEGYPGRYIKGQFLGTLATYKNIKIDYANVIEKDGQLYGNGGRVAMIVAEADKLDEAQADVYEYMANLRLKHIFYRHDIGYKATNKSYY